MQNFRYLVVCVAIVWGLVATVECSAANPPEFSDVSQRISEARQKVRSISYKLEIEGEELFAEHGWRQSTSQCEISEKGPLRIVSRTNSSTFRDGHIAPQQTSSRAVLAEGYLAKALVNFAAQRWTFPRANDMSRSARSAIGAACGPSILQFGYGDGSESFSARYLQDASLSRWEVAKVTRPDGLQEYHLKRFAVKDPTPNAESDWVVDPNQGWLITSVRRYTPSGELLSVLECRPKAVAPDVYIVESAERKVYADRASVKAAYGLDIGDKPISSTTIRALDIVLNPELPDDLFSMDFLGLAPGAIVSDMDPDNAAAD